MAAEFRRISGRTSKFRKLVTISIRALEAWLFCYRQNQRVTGSTTRTGAYAVPPSLRGFCFSPRSRIMATFGMEVKYGIGKVHEVREDVLVRS